MSMLIKGIDMPKNGESIRLVITSSGDVVETWSSGLAKMYHPRQAIQLSKGHGKIVDLDDLVVKYWDGNSMEIDNEAYDNVPTILEAEE